MPNHSKLVTSLAIAFLALAACNKDEDPKGTAGSAEAAKSLTVIDVRLKIAVDMPDGWASKSGRLVSVRDANEKSGLKGLDGAFGYYLGPKNDKGNVEELVTLFVVPKDKADFYEQNKWDRDAMKGITAGDYVVFTYTRKPDDPGVQKVLSSMKYQP